MCSPYSLRTTCCISVKSKNASSASWRLVNSQLGLHDDWSFNWSLCLEFMSQGTLCSIPEYINLVLQIQCASLLISLSWSLPPFTCSVSQYCSTFHSSPCPSRWCAMCKMPSFIPRSTPVFCFQVALTVIHRSRWAVTNGEGLGESIMWMMLGGCELDVGGAGPIVDSACPWSVHRPVDYM